MSQFMHTVRFVFGLSMLAGGAVLAEPLASALLAASRNGPPAAESPLPGTQAGLPAAMIGALRKLAQKNLSNLTPHRWFSGFYYSHPTLVEREAALASAD